MYWWQCGSRGPGRSPRCSHCGGPLGGSGQAPEPVSAPTLPSSQPDQVRSKQDGELPTGCWGAATVAIFAIGIWVKIQGYHSRGAALGFALIGMVLGVIWLANWGCRSTRK